MKIKSSMFIFTIGASCLFFGLGAMASSLQNIIVTSIVQRVDGVFFGVTTSQGSKIVSASEAKNLIERVCPRVKFAPGVMQ